MINVLKGTIKTILAVCFGLTLGWGVHMLIKLVVWAFMTNIGG